MNLYFLSIQQEPSIKIKKKKRIYNMNDPNGSKSKKCPSYISGYADDGQPLYSYVRVYSAEEVAVIEKEIKLKELKELREMEEIKEMNLKKSTSDLTLFE